MFSENLLLSCRTNAEKGVHYYEEECGLGLQRDRKIHHHRGGRGRQMTKNCLGVSLSWKFASCCAEHSSSMSVF